MASHNNKDQIVSVIQALSGSKIQGQLKDPLWLHPFPARMPLCVAEYIIKNMTTPGATVLDPMAGSGTTIIAAQRLGRRGIGFDKDPLAVLISRTATYNFSSENVDKLKIKILQRAKELIQSADFKLTNVSDKLLKEDKEFIHYWFPIQSQKQLFALAASIKEENDSPEKDLAWVIFSSLIIAKSSGASFGIDIPHTRPHKKIDKPIVLPFDEWNRRFRAAIARLPFIDSESNADIRIQIGDARALELEDETVDFILTSPPYLNAIDYLRAHKFSLVWMGYRIQELRELRGTMVGTERGLWNLDGLPSDLEQRINVVIKESRRRAMLRHYLSDLRKILEEIKRVLKPKGFAVMLVGPTIINSKRTDAVEIVSKLGESICLNVVGSSVRHLSIGRRTLPLPSFNTQNSLAHRMRREVIIALSK